MKEYKHLGSYGLLIKDDKVLLITKKTGPYDGKLDLPGGSIEFGETPEEALERELFEETGIEITKYNLYDSSSVTVDWNNNGVLFKVHHIGIFYIIEEYKNEIKEYVEIEDQNDDSLGAKFYEINSLKKENLSEIAILELAKLGCKLK